MQQLQKFYSHKILKEIERDPLLDDNLDKDMNSIDWLIKVRYMLKTFKLILMLFNVSYFTGILWIIYCDVMS